MPKVHGKMVIKSSEGITSLKVYGIVNIDTWNLYDENDVKYKFFYQNGCLNLLKTKQDTLNLTFIEGKMTLGSYVFFNQEIVLEIKTEYVKIEAFNIDVKYTLISNQNVINEVVFSLQCELK